MPIGLPNCSRVFACSMESSSARCAMPTASSATAATARFVRRRHADPSPLDQRLPRARIPAGLGVGQLRGALERVAVGEDRPRLAPQLLLLVGEGEVHQRLLGSPKTRSAMMLRRISDVPASIVFPRERSCWYCQ